MASNAAASTSYLLPGQPLPANPSPSSSSSSSSSSASTTLHSASGVYPRGSHFLASLIGTASYAKAAKKKGSAVATVTPLRPSLLRLPEPDAIVLCRVTRITTRQAVCSILLVHPPQESSDAPPISTSTLSQSLSSGAANHAAGEDPSGLDFSGVIRQQDVRATETDKVRMSDCFAIGDLVKAKVISLGDTRSYYLSTAENELGVIFAMARPQEGVLASSSTGGASIHGPHLALLPTKFVGQAVSQKQSPAEGQSVPGALVPLNWQEMMDPQTGRKEKRKVAKPEGI